MKLPTDFLAGPGKTLFMAVANPQAVLVTRTGNKMRRRTLNFTDPHAGLDWCLQRAAIFVLLPRAGDNNLN
jgi:hypothetical protein